MKTQCSIFLFLLCIMSTAAQDTLKISDLEFLKDSHWEGQLTYKDYGSGELSSIDATMQIQVEKDKIRTTIQYTYEPNKNNTSTIRIRKKGTYFGNEKIISNSFQNGTRTIVTTFRGKDNNKKATLFKTYQFNDERYKVTKEVELDGESQRFVRNTYEFRRILDK